MADNDPIGPVEATITDPASSASDSNQPDQDCLISQFVGITGADSERGKLYLESTGNQLDLAIAAYFEEVDERVLREQQIQADLIKEEQERQRLETEARQTPNLFTPPEPTMGSDDKKKASQDKPRFGTLGSLAPEDEDMDSDEEPGQAFYAGGSDHSGQQVLGPPKKRDPEKIVKSMFESAKKHGGQVVEDESPQTRRSVAFGGAGNRLGSGAPDDPSSRVGVSLNTSSAAGVDVSTGPPTVDMVLKLWRNGFSLDDGPLRTYEDPANGEFLQSIRAGEIPKELLNSSRGEVNLNMEDHRHEEYQLIKKPIRAFAGEGQRLGAVAPEVIAAAIAPGQNSKSDEEAAQKELAVDTSKPITNIQIRLADGSRLVLKINTDQKVSRIREYICRARPGAAAQVFTLMITFPNRELKDEELTIESADLKNASIVQKFL